MGLESWDGEETVRDRAIRDPYGGIPDREAKIELAAFLKRGPGRTVADVNRAPARKPPGPPDLSHIRCYWCNQMGHFRRDCPLKGQTQ